MSARIWFLTTTQGSKQDLNGPKQGPFTGTEVQAFIMDGALSVSSQIFDGGTQTWIKASELFPTLVITGEPALQLSTQHQKKKSHEGANAPGQMSSLSSGEGKAWSPPPRPNALKDRHVIPVTEDPSETIDYFALISARKKVTAPTVQALQDSVLAKGADKSGRSPKVGKPDSRAMDRASPSASAAMSGLGSGGTSASSDSDTMVGPAGYEYQTGSSESLRGRVVLFFRLHRKLLSAAAATGFVILGTFGLLQYISLKSSREPAGQNAAQGGTQSKTREVPTASAQPTAPNWETVGSGKNRVARPGGSLTGANVEGSAGGPGTSRNIAVPTPATPSPNGGGGTNNSPYDHRESDVNARYEDNPVYSNSRGMDYGGGSGSAAGQPNPALPPPGYNPNEGAVVPPGGGYSPGPAGAAGGSGADPNSYPTDARPPDADLRY